MSATDRSDRYCIVGAGPSGLAVAKTFNSRGIPFDCLEREDAIGGLWDVACPRSAAYETTTMISSKRLTRYTDFPVPSDYPAFLDNAQALAYLKSYAENFSLHEGITLQAPVARLEAAEGGWHVQVEGEKGVRLYKGAVIATGHHAAPNWPQYEGEFTGEVMHALDYREPGQLAGKRVLVVGSGNSGCDIAGDGVRNAAKVYHSVRRGYHFLPKFIFGRPSDVILEHTEKWPLPRALRIRFYEAVLSLIVGPPERYGLPKPDHPLFATHPLIDSNYLTHVAHKRIAIKPDVVRASGPWIEFDDGSSEEVDLIVCATGYQPSFPFMDEKLLVSPEGRCDLFLNVFHPEHDTLFAMTLLQTNGGFWQLADYQAQLIAHVIEAAEKNPKQHKWFRRQKMRANGAAYRNPHASGSRRHALEVEFFKYRDTLKRYIRKLS